MNRTMLCAGVTRCPGTLPSVLLDQHPLSTAASDHGFVGGELLRSWTFLDFAAHSPGRSKWPCGSPNTLPVRSRAGVSIWLHAYLGMDSVCSRCGAGVRI